MMLSKHLCSAVFRDAIEWFLLSKHLCSAVFDEIEEEFEDNCIDVDELTSMCQSRDAATKTVSCSENISLKRGVLESSTDAMEWNLELERILPYLKTTGNSGSKVTHPAAV